MSEAAAEATWTEDDSETYLGLSEIAVPDREKQIDIVVALIGAAVARASGGPATVAELCCGGGELAETLLERIDGLSYLGLDGSGRMLDRTRERTARFAGRTELRPFDLAATDWRTGLDLTACVSSLAVHHLDGPGKAALFADIRKRLRPGGVFVLADLIEPATETGREIAADAWDDAARSRSRSIQGGEAGYEAFQATKWNLYRHGDDTGVDTPSGVFEQMRWLSEAGFADIDLHYMVAGHVIFSAWAPR